MKPEILSHSKKHYGSPDFFMEIKIILNYLVQLAEYKLHAQHFIALLEILKNM
jgi:hypothetical protein